MDLTDVPIALGSHLDLKKLTWLSLTICDGIDPLLDALAVSFTILEGSGSSPALKKLEVAMLGSEPAETTQALENLLKSWTGAQYLWLATSALEVSNQRMINIECFVNHRESLQYLGVCAGHPSDPRYYATADLQVIIMSCRKLQTLAINFPPLTVCRLQNLGQGFRLQMDDVLHAKTELETFLEILASHQSIHIVRNYSKPHVDFDAAIDPSRPQSSMTNDQVPLARATMQHFATEIMRYLRYHCSNIKVLSTGPLYAYYDKICLDADGHKWPNYHFVRGRTVDARGHEQLIALPLAEVDVEIPDEMAYFRWG